jgi:hypothetical protein
MTTKMTTRSRLATSTVAVALCACQPPQEPRLPPTTPTDPSTEQTLAFQPADVLDASIISDGGPANDATAFELDAGLSAR